MTKPRPEPDSAGLERAPEAQGAQPAHRAHRAHRASGGARDQAEAGLGAGEGSDEASRRANASGAVVALASAALRQARRLVLLVVGGTVVLIGIVMIVTPGPAIVVIPAGLAILAIEFTWARRLLRRVKVQARLAQRARRRRAEGTAGA